MMLLTVILAKKLLNVNINYTENIWYKAPCRVLGQVYQMC